MSKELEEILDRWKLYISLTKKFSNKDMELLKIEEIEELLDYISNLQQENKQLKECYCNRTDCIGRIKDSKKYDSVKQQLDNSNSILTELEEWLNKIIEITANLDEKGTCKNVLDKIQKLKEKYK